MHFLSKQEGRWVKKRKKRIAKVGNKKNSWYGGMQTNENINFSTCQMHWIQAMSTAKALLVDMNDQNKKTSLAHPTQDQKSNDAEQKSRFIIMDQ